jgi:hypothetical protein
MADINLTNGEAYVFAKIDDKAVILRSSDNAHAKAQFNNDVEISGSSLTVNSSGTAIKLLQDSTTTTPQLYIDQNGNGDAGVRLSRGNKSWTMGIDYSDSDKFKICNGASVGSDTDISITTAGRVGIGTEDPPYKLSVEYDGSSDFVSQIYNSDTGTGASCLRLKVNNSGGISADNVFIVFVNGADGILGSIRGNPSGPGVSMFYTSDRRLKKGIRNTRFGVKDLLNIKVRDYEFKGHNQTATGLVAQELSAIYPQAVSAPDDGLGETCGDDPWGVDYGSLTPLLIKSMQDQQHMIEQLESRIKLLENKK